MDVVESVIFFSVIDAELRRSDKLKPDDSTNDRELTVNSIRLSVIFISFTDPLKFDKAIVLRESGCLEPISLISHSPLTISTLLMAILFLYFL